MLNCTTKKYASIYAPWLRQSRDLLDMVDYEPGQKLLDLCGGTGAVSLSARFRRLRDGPDISDITLFDLNPRCNHPDIKKVRGKAEDLALYFTKNTFDIVVCRQAVGYLKPGLVFPAVFRILQPGGRFVFNSFISPMERLPGEAQRKPYSWKFYKYDGDQYIEFHYFWEGRIVHLQWRFGKGWDVTYFRYHKVHDLTNLLYKCGFNVYRHEHGRGVRWVATKPQKLEAVS